MNSWIQAWIFGCLGVILAMAVSHREGKINAYQQLITIFLWPIIFLLGIIVMLIRRRRSN